MGDFIKTIRMVATLGTEPQVVTLGLDELLKQGEKVSKVTVIHTDPKLSPIDKSLTLLQRVFNDYQKEAIDMETLLLHDGVVPLADTVSSHQIQQSFEQLYQFLLNCKRNGERLHLLVAGGRKTMSLFAFAVAQILFDENDHVWYLVSDDALIETKQFHAHQSEKVSLIEIPFIRWSFLPGFLQSFLLYPTLHDTVTHQHQKHQQMRATKAQAFLKAISRAENELLVLLVNEGLSNEALAERLGKSPRTIANQLSSIYSKFAVHYGFAPHLSPDRGQVIATLKGLI